MVPLPISPLASTGPTVAAEMGLCGLRAGLASCREADAWVLHDPRLWLGIAYHSLMEKARKGFPVGALQAAWNEAVASFSDRAAGHQFDRRFASTESWPGYFLAEQRALSAANELASMPREFAADIRSAVRRTVSGTEARLTARAGRLVGRPDRFDRKAVTDYKSNLPDEASPAGLDILRRNRRQIQIYAAMVAESAGFWPQKGIIAAASGKQIEFDLVAAECDAEADRAVDDLENWNRKLASARQPSDIANPSEQGCHNCRFQLVCPAFWSWLELRKPTLPPYGIAIKGPLKYVKLGNDGDVQTVALTGAASTLPQITTASLVTRRSIHGDLSQVSSGAECRIIGAEMRRDGRLVADMWTLLLPTERIPPIVIHQETKTHSPTEVRAV